MAEPINLLIILSAVSLILLMLIAAISIFKGKSNTINRIKRQYDTLEDELRRQREDNLHLRNDLSRINKLDVLFSSSMIRLTEILNPVEIAKTAKEFLREYLETREIAVFLWDEQGKRLAIVAQDGLNENWLPKLVYNLGEGKIGVAAKKHLPIGKREADMLKIPEPYPIFNPDICYPVVFQDNLYGVVALSRDVDFKDREKNLLGVVSKIIAVSLKNTWNLKLFQNLASIDPLTKIYNIGYFKDRLQEALNNAQKTHNPLSIAIIDLDKFKIYNDTYGHQAGDQLLISLSQLFAKYFQRPSVLARYGGDEFIVMCPNTKKRNVADVMNILLEDLNRRNFDRGREGVKVTFSAGIAAYPDDGGSVVELVKSADEALYVAKGAGRNMVQLYSRKRGGI